MKELPLTGPKFEDQTPQTFMLYVKSLLNNNNISKEVSGISLTIGSKKTVIKVLRESKSFTRDEITILAKEYGVAESFLLELFKKRKIGVTYEDSDERRNIEVTIKAKKNAGPRKPSRRKNQSLDKLQQLVDNSRLLEESSVFTVDEVEK